MSRAPVIRPTRVEVDTDTLRANARRLRAIAETELYAVVKADAYGHGAPEVAGCLADDGAVAGFCVSLVEEGSALRAAGIERPILVMGPSLAGGYDEIVSAGLTAVVSDLADLDGLAAALRRGARPPAVGAQPVQGSAGAASVGSSIAVHLKVDTGMGRLGIQPAELEAACARLVRGDTPIPIEVVGLMTHFACADTDDPADPDCMTYAQLAAFDDAVRRARQVGIEPRALHAANSAATLMFPAARRDLVRCGLALYGNGLQPETGVLRQAVRLVSEIAQVREVAAGASVSYGALWRAERRSWLAVVPIGYADGVPRRLTGRGQVLIGGQRCPLVGAVSMDISIVDVTDLVTRGRSVAVGDEVVFLGRQQDGFIPVSAFAAWAEISEYEVTCGLSKRVPRVYRAGCSRAPAAGRAKARRSAVHAELSSEAGR